MFKDKSYKIYVMTLIQLLVVLALIIGYFIEFFSYFLISDSFTLLELPVSKASVIEFIVFTLLSVFLSLISIWVIRAEKLGSAVEYFICIVLIIANMYKLFFFIPSITLDKEYFFYIIKQYVPIVTNLVTIFFATLQISEIKYKRPK